MKHFYVVKYPKAYFFLSKDCEDKISSFNYQRNHILFFNEGVSIKKFKVLRFYYQIVVFKKTLAKNTKKL